MIHRFALAAPIERETMNRECSLFRGSTLGLILGRLFRSGIHPWLVFVSMIQLLLHLRVQARMVRILVHPCP